MRRIIYVLLFIAAAIVINWKLIEIAFELGYAQIDHEVVLQNEQNLKVKCVLYSFEYVDEIRLDNKFQTCINEYEAQGFTLLSDLQKW
jgi:hypothetical protein